MMSLAKVFFLSSVDQPGLACEVAGDVLPAVQFLKEFTRNCFPRFYLDGIQPLALIHDKVELESAPVPEEVKVGLATLVQAFFHCLGNNEVLEYGPSLRVIPEVAGFQNPQQVAEQSRVEEIDLGCFDEAFVEITEPGLQEEDDSAGFKYREPRSYSVVGYTAFRTER